MSIAKNRKWMSLCCFLLLILLIESVGGLLTDTSVASWYPTLRKASWNPPSWVFGPVWTFLYVAIAISGWLIYIQPCSQKRTRALAIYAVQLLFNMLWSFLFFFLQSPILGLIDIFFLIVMISINIAVFRPLNRTAACLLIPYLVWTIYAATLNGFIWLFN